VRARVTKRTTSVANFIIVRASVYGFLEVVRFRVLKNDSWYRRHKMRSFKAAKMLRMCLLSACVVLRIWKETMLIRKQRDKRKSKQKYQMFLIHICTYLEATTSHPHDHPRRQA